MGTSGGVHHTHPILIHTMPSQKSNSKAEPTKQKSLMTWFSKAPNNTGASATKSAPNASTPQSRARLPADPHTPESKGLDLRVLNSSAAVSSKYSDAGSSVKDTPPTSDPIDIDMLSSTEEEENQRVQAKFVSTLLL